jgi:hypothetical protein
MILERLLRLERQIRADAEELRQAYSVLALRRADEMEAYADELRSIIDDLTEDDDEFFAQLDALVARGWDEV